ncbi:YwmB family TATA-box binding protein [Virgibacillus sp. C22-A2]|uniref:YwmB family TATA-box binding protein n=1 Tax=Virgibacillus tibetensis TaxID=3042313 RepID=A0ABU6KGQ0_9BACI|nr:YwmB family TATA-box binding protein [Virgibacillus sp. C22-A2]
MRKMVLIILLFLVITTETVAQGAASDEMIDLAEFATERDLLFENWQVTWKETISREKSDDIIKDLKNSHLVTITKEKNSINYSFRNTLLSGDVSETYNVVMPKNEQHNAELIVIIEGEFWNESIKKEYLTVVESIERKYFTKSVKKFACLSVGDNGIMDSDSLLTNIIEHFNIEHINTQYDTVENSRVKKIIYGYISLWNQQISIEKVPQNVQIAIIEQELGERTYTIGTPILINEY